VGEAEVSFSGEDREIRSPTVAVRNRCGSAKSAGHKTNMRIRDARFTPVILALLQTVAVTLGQDKPPTREGQPPNVGRASDPYALYDTRPVILHGPYLIAPTETSAVIAWTTDTPCHSKVAYGIGELTMEATNSEHGLLPVGTNHAVRIAGLKPGQTYAYQARDTGPTRDFRPGARRCLLRPTMPHAPRRRLTR
jgi:hypothetical protein